MKKLIAALIVLGSAIPAQAKVMRPDYFCPPYQKLYLKWEQEYRKCVKLSYVKVRNTDSTDTITYTVNGRTRALKPGSGALVLLRTPGPVTITIDEVRTVRFNAQKYDISFWRYNIEGKVGHRLIPKSSQLIEK